MTNIKNIFENIKEYSFEYDDKINQTFPDFLLFL
jgi:hypothetical protein